MAQIREFESTTESYFILDGVSYPKVYEAMLDNGYSDTKIKLVGTNRDTTPLVFSTQYTNIRVDGDSFDTALEAISRLNQIVFSKGGGSGGGGTTGGYVPLTGTEEGKPVTGPIYLEHDNDNGIFSDGSTSNNVIIFNGTVLSITHNNTEGKNTSIKLLDDGSIEFLSENNGGLKGNSYNPSIYIDNSYIQKKYVDLQHSYSTEEIKTGGTWIDNKDIYTITQLTADTPPTMETVFPTEVIGLYTVYKYTKP
jgi:hypothetical protein